MKATAPFAFDEPGPRRRCHRLQLGDWNTNGDFPTFYIQDSVANGLIPVFTYYMLCSHRRAAAAKATPTLRTSTTPPR